MKSWGRRICGSCSRRTRSAAPSTPWRPGDLHIDYAKHLVTDETLALLHELAAATGVAALRDAMFRGEKINITEDRAVLHTALRAPENVVVKVDGEDVVPEVHAVLRKMAAFSDRVRSGEWTGHTGKRIRNVVNIGIGGSDLGPAMAYEALRAFSDRGLTVRFVSNVDGADLHEAVRDLDAAETLFIIASKTFTTIETITNATSARNWLLTQLGAGEEAVARHFVRCRPTRRRSPGSASTRPTCSASGTGSAAVTPSTRPSGSP